MTGGNEAGKRFGRSGLSRWLKRSHPARFELVTGAAVSLIEKAGRHAFAMQDPTFESLPVQVNGLNLERRDQETVAFLEVVFDKRESLRFQMNFGLRRRDAPYAWVRSGALSKDGSDSMSSRWWGPGWATLSKERAFLRDWQIAEDNLDQVADFLSGGLYGANVIERSIGGR